MKITFLLLSFAVLLFTAPAWAGAWTLEPGHTETISTLSFYNTDGFFNAKSDRVGRGGRYRKYDLDLYGEYGLAEAYTVGMQTSYQVIHTRSGDQIDNGSNLGDVAFHLRERLWRDDYNAFAIQQMVSIPGPYDANDRAAPGYGQTDLELRALFGHSGDFDGLHYYLDLQTAFRKRLEGPADEIRFDIGFGVKPSDDFTLLLQSFTTLGLRNPTTSAFITSSGPDYDLSKVQLSGVLDITDDLSLQAGGRVDIAGRNTGAGKAVFFAIWRKF